MVPGLDGGVLAPVGLLRPASAQDQGVQGLLPRPASLTARQLQSLMPPPHPWQPASLPFSSQLFVLAKLEAFALFFLCLSFLN